MAAVTEARYAVRFENETKTPVVSNYAQDLRARFGDNGIEVALRGKESSGSHTLGIRLSRWGREGAINAPGRGARQASENRVEYVYEGITEWWTNTPRGLEQGFTIAAPPEGPRGEPIVIDLQISEDWSAEPNGDSIRISGSRGERLHYRGLVVTGADDERLSARMSGVDRTIRVVVDDAGAVYPITVDPLLTNQEARLSSGTEVGQPGAAFGVSVALSGDTALVGAAQEDSSADDAGAAYVFVRNGMSWTLQAPLFAADGAAGDWFGYSVALSGDTAVVGAFFGNVLGGAPGAAYVFVRSGSNWTQQARLLPTDPAAGAQFGNSVSVSGDTALVGAFKDDNASGVDAGSAYVFVRSGDMWSQQTKLLPIASSADEFGYSVALSGNTALISTHANAPAGGTGAGYVLTRSGTTWSPQATIVPVGGDPDEQFGFSVALSGDTALIGARLADNPGAVDSGAAYVFTRTGTSWNQQQRLLATDAAAGDLFGVSVALSGDTALAGAPADDTTRGANAGSAYVFVRSGGTWTQQTRLQFDEGSPGDQLGTSVAVSGDFALAGAHQDDNSGGGNAGSAFIFSRSGTSWSRQAHLLGSGGARSDQFGQAVALDGETALIGVPVDDTQAGADAGSVYVFVRSGSAWSLQAQLFAADAEVSQMFGYAVALRGDVALVGARGDDTSPTVIDTGAAYVFVRSGSMWTQQTKLLRGGLQAGDSLGNSVALSGDTALVGSADDDNINGIDAGSAHVWVEGGGSWSYQGALLASDAAPSDSFGWSVALDGDTALIGAFRDDTAAGTNAGSAYVFVRDGGNFTEQAQLLPGDGAFNDSFGYAVALSGDTALVGSISSSAYVFTRTGTAWSAATPLRDAAAPDSFINVSVALSGDIALIGAPGDDAAGTDAGAALFFIRNGSTWSQEAKVLASDGAAFDSFGNAVALSGNTALIGASLDDTLGGFDTGSAYVFRFDVKPSITAAAPVSRTAGSTGEATIASVSDPDPAETLTVTASSVPSGITVSDITNESGTITATVAASCTATTGANVVTLQVQDSGGQTATAELTVNVSANTPPTLGSYSDTPVAPGGSTTVTPSAAPADNGTVTVTASASAGFTGTVSAASSTGIVSISNANSGSYTITVTATDNCDATAMTSFTLQVGIIAPTGLVASATSATTIALSWNSVNGADHYELIRNSGSGFSTIAMPVTNAHIDTVGANTAHVYRVRAVAPTGEMSAYSNIDVATTTIFTDDPLVAGATSIKAEHLTQIRTAVNAVRVTADLDPATFTDPNPAGLPIKAVHITELRAALDAARLTLSLSALVYTNAPLNGMPVRALDFTELRNGVE